MGVKLHCAAVGWRTTLQFRDTYTPQRWFYVAEYAEWARGWLAGLPAQIAENIAYRSAEALLVRVHK